MLAGTLRSPPARFEHNPGRVHWDVAKRVVRYLKGTKQWCLALGGKSPQIAVFTDADWGSHRDDRRSIARSVWYHEVVQLEVQEAALRRALVDRSGVHGPLPSHRNRYGTWPFAKRQMKLMRSGGCHLVKARECKGQDAKALVDGNRDESCLA